MEKVSDIFTGALLESLSRYELSVRTLTSSGVRGERRSRRKGNSIEYADHRQYTHGDDLRRLDWHALARLDQMLIRLYAAEETLPLEVILDTSASMDFGTPTKYITAARIGCALTQIALLRSTPALWRLAGEKALEPVKLSGRNDLGRIFRVLDELVPDGRGGLSDTIRRSTLAGPRRRSLVVLTDGYDRAALHPALRACRASGTDVYLVLVLSPEETDPGMRGEFTLQDAETGVDAALTLDGRALKRYMALLAGFRKEWTDFCVGHGVALLEVGSDVEIGPELMRQLATGGLVQ
jgi:uncharacterized protein (DUF58 family)